VELTVSIAAWLNQTISVAQATGKDAYGKVTYGAPRTVAARVEVRRTVVRDGRGDEAVAQHRLWTLEAINLTDRIWLPGASSAVADASNLPLTVSSSADKLGSRTLYKVEL
jgi:hypothetical protein